MWIVVKIDGVWKARPYDERDNKGQWVGIFPDKLDAQAYVMQMNFDGR